VDASEKVLPEFDATETVLHAEDATETVLCARDSTETVLCARDATETWVSGKLMNQAPLATGDVVCELGCSKKAVCLMSAGKGDALEPVGSKEIVCTNESCKNMDGTELGRYEVYVVSPQLKGELGLALIDSGSMVSLVQKSSIVRFNAQEQKIRLQGVRGKQVNVLGLINLKIENSLDSSWLECYVVESLPRELDVILGQDWLEKSGYSVQKTVPDIIPPYSEKVIKCKTSEKGIRFIEHQIL
jgi:hypothetical protein